LISCLSPRVSFANFSAFRLGATREMSELALQLYGHSILQLSRNIELDCPLQNDGAGIFADWSGEQDDEEQQWAEEKPQEGERGKAERVELRVSSEETGSSAVAQQDCRIFVGDLPSVREAQAHENSVYLTPTALVTKSRRLAGRVGPSQVDPDPAAKRQRRAEPQGERVNGDAVGVPEPVRFTITFDSRGDSRSCAPSSPDLPGLTSMCGEAGSEGDAVFKVSEFASGFIFKANAATVDEVKRRNLFGLCSRGWGLTFRVLRLRAEGCRLA
jgi:hypothetical protein